MMSHLPLSRRSGRRAAVIGAGLLALVAVIPLAAAAPAKLVVADQNEEVQTMMAASGEQAKLAATVSYANFLGGPAILEAFRAGALDVGSVGSAPPIQAQAAGETIRIVSARVTSGLDYKFAPRPGLKAASFQDLRGRSIAYAEGTGRQPYVLEALKQAGLKTGDVSLVPLRVSDFPDAVRSGQVDFAPLNEPHYSRYLADYADRDARALPDAVYAQMPRKLTYLYASEQALKDPARTAAIRDLVIHWIAANRWAQQHPDDWISAYYVAKTNLKPADGRAIVTGDGAVSFPPLATLIALQQETIDLIHQAGDIPERLDAKQEFDLRFDDLTRPQGE